MYVDCLEVVSAKAVYVDFVTEVVRSTVAKAATTTTD